jgi:hypothetical protein
VPPLQGLPSGKSQRQKLLVHVQLTSQPPVQTVPSASQPSRLKTGPCSPPSGVALGWQLTMGAQTEGFSVCTQARSDSASPGKTALESAPSRAASPGGRPGVDEHAANATSAGAQKPAKRKRHVLRRIFEAYPTRLRAAKRGRRGVEKGPSSHPTEASLSLRNAWRSINGRCRSTR